MVLAVAALSRQTQGCVACRFRVRRVSGYKVNTAGLFGFVPESPFDGPPGRGESAG